MGRESSGLIVWLPSLNNLVFYLLTDKLKSPAPLRITILENNGRADRTDVIKVKII